MVSVCQQVNWRTQTLLQGDRVQMAVHCLRDRTSLPSTAIAARTIPGRKPERGTAPAGAATQKRLRAHFLRPLPGASGRIAAVAAIREALAADVHKARRRFLRADGLPWTALAAWHLRGPCLPSSPTRHSAAARSLHAAVSRWPASVPLVKANRLRDLPARLTLAAPRIL